MSNESQARSLFSPSPPLSLTLAAAGFVQKSFNSGFIMPSVTEAPSWLSPPHSVNLIMIESFTEKNEFHVADTYVQSFRWPVARIRRQPVPKSHPWRKHSQWSRRDRRESVPKQLWIWSIVRFWSPSGSHSTGSLRDRRHRKAVDDKINVNYDAKKGRRHRFIPKSRRKTDGKWCPLNRTACKIHDRLIEHRLVFWWHAFPAFLRCPLHWLYAPL